MTTNGTPRPDLDPALLEASAPGAAAEARERFVHGLLESLYNDSPADSDRRVRRFIDTIEAPIPIAAHRHAQPRRWPLLSSMAAAVALVAFVMLGWPRERSALASVQQSITASATAGDRHYDISVTPPDSDTLTQIATIDVRDPSHYLVSATSPQGDSVTLGRNGDQSWAIHPDGQLERYPQRRILPPWINFGTSTVMLVSVDDLLSNLEKSYDLRRGDDAPLPGVQGPTCERITALHKGGTPDPNTVDLWIDRDSHVVRRLELHWTNPPGARRAPPAAGPRGQDDDNAEAVPRRPHPPRPMDDGPNLQRDPLEEARFALDNGLPFPRDDRAGPPRRPGPPPPQGDDRRRDDDGPEGNPPPPPDGDFDRPPPPPPQGDEDGPRRPGPPNHPRGPRPQFLDGPPDFARHPPPPRTLIFQLKDGPSFPEGWFDPAAHQPK